VICLSISLELFFHVEFASTPDEVWTTLEGLFWKHNDLEDFIPENAKKNLGENLPEYIGKGHALFSISSSPNTWILYSRNRLLDPSINIVH
jgi:hypothetical protein